MEIEQKAQQFATKAHKEQYRKDKITPYIEHPRAVAKLLKEVAEIKDLNIICASWLHDVIEDCKVTKEQLEHEFNPEIARIVCALTRDIDRQAYLERIRHSDYAIQIVKLADVVHNCSTLGQEIPLRTIQRKIDECNALYLNLAKRICPKFYLMLEESLGRLKYSN